jgi:hypothetical protein
VKAYQDIKEMRADEDGRRRFTKLRTGSVPSGGPTRSQARDEARTPSVGRQNGANPSDQYVEGGEWGLAVLLETART